MRNLTSHEVLRSVSWLFPVLEDFFPKEKKESHFPRDSMHCLLHPTNLLKKRVFSQSHPEDHCTGETTVLSRGKQATCPHFSDGQILMLLTFMHLPHRYRF